MTTYVGLDVGLRKTAVYVTDENQRRLLEATLPTDPAEIALAIASTGAVPKLVGMEAGVQPWLLAALRERGLPAIQIDAVRVRAITQASPLKTDRTDARAIAHILQSGLFRKVHEKSPEAVLTKTLLMQRAISVTHTRAMKNAIRSALGAHGVLLPPRSDGRFADRVRCASGTHKILESAVTPTLRLFELGLETVAHYDRVIADAAAADRVARLLCTMPGIGAVTALAYKAAIDDPWRFTSASHVGAYLGLTPNIYASGQSFRSGRISRHGDAYLRSCLFQAARSHLFRSKTQTDLQIWARSLRDRRGAKRALTALSRKMAVVMLVMWQRDEPFRAVRERKADGVI